VFNDRRVIPLEDDEVAETVSADAFVHVRLWVEEGGKGKASIVVTDCSKCYVFVVLCRCILFYCLREVRESYTARRMLDPCDVFVHVPNTNTHGAGGLDISNFVFYFFFLSILFAIFFCSHNQSSSRCI
jgi:hypothetical protein